MKDIPFFQVDAFSHRPFGGNPAAICIPGEELPGELMQKIAAENNLAETAFIQKTSDSFDLRWFTPATEVKLCGHATLASAHILWQENILAAHETVRFNTLSGVLTARKEADWITIDLPACLNEPAKLPEEVEKALKVEILNVVYAKDRYIVELADPEEVKRLKPDFAALSKYDMLVITAKQSSSPYDFISRSFAPSLGVDEDPVTGSSHCCLVPYYAQQLRKEDFFAYQASARGGELKLQLSGDRVLISGQAVTVIKGKFVL